MPGVLAGAVVAELAVRAALLHAVLEIVDGRAGAREHLAHGRQLGRLGIVRRAGDRDLVVVEVAVALDERDRLQRLHRRAQMADERRSRPTLAAVVTACTRCTASTMSPRPTVTLIASIHRREPTLPELPEVEAWRRQLDPLVERVAGRARRPGAHRDAEDVRPAAAALDGKSARGVERRAKRFLLPTDDGELVLMVHLMSAGRLKYVAPGGKGAKTPMFRAAVRRRRRAAADRGRLEEARRRLAAAPGRAARRARAPRPGGRPARRPRTSRASSRRTRGGCTRCCATSG